MGQNIYGFEAEFRNGHVTIEQLPANDGGGAREVAGINLKYDPQEEPVLEELVKSGRYQEVEDEAVRYILEQTTFALSVCCHPAIEFLFRDTIFNRGKRGLIITAQHALGVARDGTWGPITAQAEAQAERNVPAFLQTFTNSRRWYESEVVGVRSNFEQGLENRWANALKAAQTFL